jgi:hypothetical protein
LRAIYHFLNIKQPVVVCGFVLIYFSPFFKISSQLLKSMVYGSEFHNRNNGRATAFVQSNGIRTEQRHYVTVRSTKLTDIVSSYPTLADSSLSLSLSLCKVCDANSDHPKPLRNKRKQSGFPFLNPFFFFFFRMAKRRVMVPVEEVDFSTVKYEPEEIRGRLHTQISYKYE